MEEQGAGGSASVEGLLTELLWQQVISTLDHLNRTAERIMVLEALLLEKGVATGEDFARVRLKVRKEREAALAVDKILDPETHAMSELQKKLRHLAEEFKRLSAEQKGEPPTGD